MLDNKKEKLLKEEYLKAKEDASILSYALKHPGYSIKLLIKHWRAKFFDYKKFLYIKEIRNITKTENYDKIIAITSPFYILEAVIEINTGKEVVWYQLDPNQSNITKAYAGRTDLLNRELRVYQEIKHAVIPRLVYKENQSNALAKFSYKMKSVEFPNVRKIFEKAAADDIRFGKDSINLLFCGTFYEDIRDPEPLFELITAFEDESIKLHIIGGGCIDKIEAWCQKTDRIVYHGYHSLQASTNAMLKADVLVNIDNSAANMLPSKINDYISACKPILNLHPSEVSNCKEYLKDYPYHISASTLSLNQCEVRCEIEKFCIKAKNSQISFEEIVQKYPFSTPEYVVNQLLQ